MSSLKQGVSSLMSGLKTVKDKTAAAVPVSGEEFKENLELSKQLAISAAGTMKDGMVATANTTKDLTVEGFSYAATKTKEAAAVTATIASAAWNPVKQKLDESGATNAAVTSYNIAAENTKKAASSLNQKIDANPNLKYAKDATASGLMAAGSIMKSGIGALGGWFGYSKAP